jgi:hypothetical protein
VTSPGLISGRGTYDTPFYNGGGRGNPEGNWPARQRVYIEGIGCYGRSEINYLAQGMWSAAAGESLTMAKSIVYAWKVQYGETPSAGTVLWLEYGYNYYQNWIKDKEY